MRWIFRLLGVVVLLVVLAVGAVFLLPAEQIAGLATRQFEAATGRALTITGRVTPTIWPVLGARVEGVTLANVAGSDAGPMLRADSVDLGVDLSALMRGSLVVRRFEARAPQIVLERDAQGVGNWVFAGVGGQGAASDQTGTSAGLPPISLDRAQITGASLRFIDRAEGTDVTVEGVSIDLMMPEVGGAATLRVNVDRNGQQGLLEASIGSVQAALAGEVVAITARISATGVEGRFEGRGGLDPIAAEGRLSLEVARLGPVLQLAGASAAEPLPAAAQPLSVATQITLAPVGSLHLRDGVVGIGSNRLTLALDATFDGARPNLAGQIGAERLDLSGFTTGGAPAPATSGGSGGWPRTAIDASALGLMDAQIGLTLGPVNTGFGTIDATRGTLTIDRARAVLALSEVRAFDGTATGELIANNRNGLSVGTNLTLRGISLMSALRQSIGFERLSGTAQAQVRLIGAGQSVDAIIRSLDGEGSLSFGAGEIVGFDLAGMLRSLDASYVGPGNSTIYQSIAATFTIVDGVLTNPDLRLEADLLDVSGNGTVDLGAQTLAYRLVPEAMRNAQTGEALRVPLLITGPWAEPRFRLDLEGLAEQRLAEERARLEARAQEELQRLETEARARAQDAVAEQLGLPPAQEGAPAVSLEDQLRNEVLRRLGGGDPAPAPAPTE